MFVPPCCPRVECPMHTAPEPGFFQRDGSYEVSCRSQLVPRFRCKHCGKRFSRQTFRLDCHARKPWLEPQIFERLCSGTGLRRIAQCLGVSRSTVERKFHKLGEQLRKLHENTLGSFAECIEMLLDELETFETCRLTRPLTVPILIERSSYFVFDAQCDTLPPRGRLTKPDRARVRADANRFGKRSNRSAKVVARVLATATRCLGSCAKIVIDTDKKRSYPGLIEKAFTGHAVTHLTTSSKAPRTTWNPLFPINLSNAMARDLMGRLHRRSWLVSKERRYLDAHLALWMVHRNYVRPWRNGERDTPAAKLGLVDRRMTAEEVVAWRQDFGPERSIHPLGRGNETAASYVRAMARVREFLRAERAKLRDVAS